MIPVLVVGEGPRDEAVVPCLVESILARLIRSEFRRWARLHADAGRGLERKLRFAMQQARDLQVVGLVATVDADVDRDSREKLRQLRSAREEDRRRLPTIPTALGCAVPHLEAWLLDDPDAVRRTLGISATDPLPSSKYPKNALGELIDRYKPHAKHIDVLKEIATIVNPERQAGKDAAGYAAFVADVREEFREHLVPPPGSPSA